MDYRNVSVYLCLCFCIIYLSSCNNNISNSTDINTITVGSEINLMGFAVIPFGKDSSIYFNKSNSEYKIVTYANMYCEPCWNNALQWKENLKYFKEFPQVSFYCYVLATPDDFKLRNATEKLDFPVLLDTRERFRIVNHLGNDPNKLTFLLNKENQVLIIGPPFTKEMRKKYLSIIRH